MGTSFLDEAWAEGRTEGMTEGRTVGLIEGKAEGRTEGERFGIEKGKAEGRTEGVHFGIEKERAEVAQRMLREHVDEALIGRVTGLGAAEIDAMRHSLNGS